MRLSPRLVLVCLILMAALGAQGAYKRHLGEALHCNTPGGLAAPLAEVPRTIGTWRGEDVPITDPKLLYADAHLQRIYHDSETGRSLKVWMAYSTIGEDRKHHPEVCMAVAGQPEIAEGRRILHVEGHEAPIQQYRFGRTGDRQLIYYWHYTLPSEEPQRLDALQTLYRRLQHPSASVTLEVFAPDRDDDDVLHVSEFVRQLDLAVQAVVGPGAVRGSTRLPVTVLH